MTKVLVLFHGVTGDTERMAIAEAEGAREVEGCEVAVKRIRESSYEEAVRVLGQGREPVAHEATVEELADYDAIIFGTPARLGNMSGQMRTFLDQTSCLWRRGALIGKVASVFTSCATRPEGHESTVLTFHPTLFHLGMIVVGLPDREQLRIGRDRTECWSPYGASTFAGSRGEREPSQQELDNARLQGKHVASIASRLVALTPVSSEHSVTDARFGRSVTA